METFDTKPQVLLYVYLPHYAQFLLEHHLEDYVLEQFRLLQEVKAPLLKHTSHLSEQEMLDFTLPLAQELLINLIDNRAHDFINAASEKWLADQLEVVERGKIETTDITYLNYVRGRAMKKWIFEYTSEMESAFSLSEEIDHFLMMFNTKLFETYGTVLKEEIDKEAYFNKQVTETIPGIIYVFDLADHKRFFTNDKLRQMLGYRKDEFRPEHEEEWAEHIHPDDVIRWEHFFDHFKTIKDGEVRSLEYRMKDVKGYYRWLRNYDSVFKRDKYNNPIQVIGITFDISDEKKISNQLQDSQVRLLEAQELTKMANFEWNFTRGTIKNSPQAFEIFEMPEVLNYEQYIGHVHPEDRAKVEHSLKRAMETGMYECEYRFLVHGKEKYIWARGYIIYRDGKPYKTIGTVQDITDRKRIEDSLLQKTIELEKTNASLQEFASVASHDLKEPLRKVTAFADRVLASEKENVSDAARKNLEKVVAATHRMRALIDDLLTYSSLEVGQEKQRCSLQEIFNSVLITLEHQIQEKGATVTSDNLPEGEFIPFQMQQLFQNLISNALKFSKKDVPPVISVTHRFLFPEEVDLTRAKSAPGYLEIRVTDNGIGFDQEASVQIFNVFQRLHSKHEYEGTGLGLAICRKIVENHGGYIYANSTLGEGAVFTIVLADGE